MFEQQKCAWWVSCWSNTFVAHLIPSLDLVKHYLNQQLYHCFFLMVTKHRVASSAAWRKQACKLFIVGLGDKLKCATQPPSATVRGEADAMCKKLQFTEWPPEGVSRNKSVPIDKHEPALQSPGRRNRSGRRLHHQPGKGKAFQHLLFNRKSKHKFNKVNLKPKTQPLGAAAAPFSRSLSPRVEVSTSCVSPCGSSPAAFISRESVWPARLSCANLPSLQLEVLPSEPPARPLMSIYMT